MTLKRLVLICILMITIPISLLFNFVGDTFEAMADYLDRFSVWCETKLG